MTGREIVIVGAGGFGRETADVIEAINRSVSSPTWFLSGVYDDSPSEVSLSRLADRGIPYLGRIPMEVSEYKPRYVIGIGSPKVRHSLASRLDLMGWAAETLIHPDAVIGSRIHMGIGTVICGGVQVSTNVRLGRHVHLNPNSTIGHDSVLEDFVSVNPAVTVSGEVRLETRALIGASSVVLQGLTIGAGAVVGASACVVRDIGPYTTVKGVPAK